MIGKRLAILSIVHSSRQDGQGGNLAKSSFNSSFSSCSAVLKSEQFNFASAAHRPQQEYGVELLTSMTVSS